MRRDASRRRGRSPGRLLVVTLFLLAAAGVVDLGIALGSGGRSVLGREAARLGEEGPEQAVGDADSGGPGASAASPPPEVAQDLSPVVATAETVRVHAPTDEPVAVAFHEAARVGPVDLRPVGVLVENGNATRFDPPADDPDGPEYAVQVSRGRAAGPTTAVDVAVPPDAPVLAPTSGVVVDVSSYVLYGEHDDVRIEIAPAGVPHLRAVAIHVEDPQVELGDVVVGGRTIIATRGRLLPFTSLIDRLTEPDRFAHVHVQVAPFDPAATPAPGPLPGDAVVGASPPPG